MRVLQHSGKDARRKSAVGGGKQPNVSIENIGFDVCLSCNVYFACSYYVYDCCKLYTHPNTLD